MLPIKFVLIAFLLLIVGLYFRRIQSRIYDRLILLTLLIIGIIMIMFPVLTTDIAHILGVGRGSDLVTYVGILGLGFMWIILYISHRELRAKLTELARTIAIQNATKSEDQEQS